MVSHFMAGRKDIVPFSPCLSDPLYLRFGSRCVGALLTQTMLKGSFMLRQCIAWFEFVAGGEYSSINLISFC